MAAEEDDEYIPNPPELNGVPDLSLLVYMEMRNVLDNIEHRYCFMSQKEIYTSISTVLIAVNPYEMLPIYGEEVIDRMQQLTMHNKNPEPPHPYAVGARSYARMLLKKENQSVIVCGESGAGKTETTKCVIRYLAETSPNPDGQGSGTIELQIMAASPILETFGNAKTILNNNSSRFGKFTKLLYSFGGGNKHAEGQIVGSTLETYLLEKSRVVFQSPNERNYHSFYYVYAGITSEQKEEWGLSGGLETFKMVNQGGSIEVPGISDSARFDELTHGLKVMRIEAERESIYKMVAAFLHLGNIEFQKDDQDFTEVTESSSFHIEMAAKLFCLTPKALIKRLTTQDMKVGRKSITKKIQYQNAIPNRDAIIKGAYEKLFLFLAGRINSELCNLDEDVDSFKFIGILDVFGFENFKKNSLEQFCINYTNEKLQEYFNYHIIQSEQEEYIKESVVWTEIEVPSSQQMIDLVEQKHKGFFAILDSSCQAPKPNIEELYQVFFKNHDKNSLVKRHKKKKERGYFGIQFTHFAEKVAYNLEEFLHKNMEKVHVDTKKMFNKSKDALVKSIVGGKSRKRRGFTSITSVFIRALNTLMRNLKATSPYFVRCVNPNKKKSNKIFTRQHVENQLRCGGIIEALRVLKLGYPTRVSYEIIYAKYQPHIENELISSMSADKFSAAILIAFGVNEEEYELGLTKIFFKPAKAAVLDEIMDQADNLTEDQYKRILEWLAESRKTQLFGSMKIYLHFQKQIRDTRALHRWKKSGRIAGHIGSLVRYLHVAKAQIEERNRNEAATVMQSYWKAYVRRVALAKKLRKHTKAVKKVYKAHKTYVQRREFMKWLVESVEITREKERKRREEEERRRKEEERKKKEEKARRKREEEERKKREEEERIREFERLKREDQERKALAQAEEEEKMSIMAAQAEAETRRQQEEEERKIREEAERKQREEEDRLRLEEEERLRQEEEKLRLEEEERKRIQEEQERKRQQEEEAKLAEEKRQKELVKGLEAEDKKKKDLLAVDEARRKHRTHSQYVNKEVAQQKKKDAMREKKKKINRIDNEIEDRYEHEEDARQRRRDDNIEKDIMVRRSKQADYDYSDDSSSDIGYDFGSGTEVDFKRIAQNGTLFMKHTGRRRNRAPQDRFVKVTFDDRGKPLRISWGSGSRHLDFSEIKLIAWGAYSPTFVTRQNELDPRSCFSIVSHHSILDLQQPDRRTVETWVHGLRDLIGQSDEEAKQLQTELRENPPIPKRDDHQTNVRQRRRRQSRRDVPKGSSRKSVVAAEEDLGGPSSGGHRASRREASSSKRRPSARFPAEKKKPEKEHKKRTKSLMLLQQDLFVMTTTTVFRNLEEENYPITQNLKDQFNPKEMYELALKNDVPWRQWQNWIREQIIQRMVQAGLVPTPAGSAGGHADETEHNITEGSPEEVDIGETPGRDRAGTNADCVLS